MPASDERLSLSDILNAIDRAVDHARGGREAFLRDPEAQDAVVRDLTLIGEAVRGVSDATRQAHSDIPWSRMAGTRERVVQADRRADRAWDIVQNELPRLRHQIADLLPVFKRPGDPV